MEAFHEYKGKWLIVFSVSVYYVSIEMWDHKWMLAVLMINFS